MRLFKYAWEAKNAGFTQTVKWLENEKAILMFNPISKEYAKII